MKTAIKISLLLLLAVLMLSSSYPYGNPAPRRTLRILMPLLERSEKVDSCLTVLRSIDTTTLTRPADKARWSLLYAMALDKNYIDTTDLSVLQPAIDHYTHWTHLNRLDKFYTWYYKGRIEENARIFDASLDSYLHAERYMKATDDVYRTRLYFGFYRDYSKTISYKKAYESSKEALLFSRRSGNNDLYLEALLTNACAAAGVFHHEEADECIKECDTVFGSFTDKDNLSRYYKAKMICYGFRKDELRDSSKVYMYRYLELCGENADVLPCLMNCIQRNDIAGGKHLIEQYCLEEPGEGIVASEFYLFRSRIKESEGDYRGAMKDVRNSDRCLNEEYKYNIYNETAYTADKYHNRLNRVELILWLSIICFILVSVLFLWILVSRNRRQQYNVLLQGYDSVRNEYQLFRNYLLKGKEWDSSQADDISFVKGRIEGLGKYFLQTEDTGICSISKKFVERVGRKKYYSLINLLMIFHCRNSYNDLKEHGMSDGELAICALLMMGCSTKEIEFILARKNIRNDCVEIRKKLGVEGGYLDDFLRHYYEEMTTHYTLKDK